MPSQVYSGSISDLPRETRFGNRYHRTGLVMDSANMSFLWLEPDAFGDALDGDGNPLCHSHPFDMFLYVIDGAVDFLVDGKWHHLDRDHFIYIPANVSHGGRPSGGQKVRLMEFFAPIRTDYLYTAEHQLALGQAARGSDGSRVDERSTREAYAAMADSAVQQRGEGAAE
ncbi:cupin domain-containing protein [Sphingomonas sp. MG17]|uniref:Cupin domain-containing protein n=1 Tax=Sphingomonas tagetis TaxID=2949092 RepID=A0A9X2HT21_9SPHN|nr:cupin domain-containing protein [Sphingomonas tagetis]MCP3732110.1 cupin domain-containing protein [Sphingomonas tagetis]